MGKSNKKKARRILKQEKQDLLKKAPEPVSPSLPVGKATLSEPEPCPFPDQCCCDDGPIQCIYVIQRGKRNGQECGKKCKEDLYCSLHIPKSVDY